MGMDGIAVRVINYMGPLQSGCIETHIVHSSVTLQDGILLAQGIQLFIALSLF